MHWASWANLFLSAWLLFGPLTHSYQSPPLVYSDIFCALLAGFLAASELYRPLPWKRWGVCLIGIWLLFAPLIFWAPQANAYTNDTLVGFLFIIFSVGIPKNVKQDGEIPPGWTYNPSDWHHRIPVIILAFLGFFIARAMASFQLGHVATLWDPFFGNGSERVLTSEVAKAFPISDAGLGAAVYLLEGLSGVVGDSRRWRTMPWMVFLFFILVVPAGVVSIVLIMLQPVVVGFWCTFCLATAFVTLISIPPAVDEIFASVQFLIKERKTQPLWTLFWLGDQSPITKSHKEAASGHQSFIHMNGMGLPWNLLFSAVLGLWIVLTPLIFDLGKTASNSNYILGALITTFAVLASAEPIRSVRYVNVLFALWIAATPLFFGGMNMGAGINQIMVGVILIILSLPKGKIDERYGGWERYIV